MARVLRLVGTESDSMTRGVDLIELHRPSGLVDIANLGLTLPEARQLLARVQQVVVAALGSAARATSSGSTMEDQTRFFMPGL